MRFVRVRKRVRGERVSIEALSERWTISYSGTTFTATKFSDQKLANDVVRGIAFEH